MNILEIDIKDIKISENNPRIATEKQIEIYKNLIEKYGFLIPVIIDSNNYIVRDDGRFLAAKELGIEKIKAVRIENLTDEDLQVIRLSEIQAADEGQWDYEKLYKELEKLGDKAFITGIDMEFVKENIPNFMETVENVEEIEVPTIEEETISLLGDLYIFNNKHRLYVGDSTKLEDVRVLMNDNKADLLVTDPPYNVAYESEDGKKIINDNMKKEDFAEFLLGFYKNAYEFLKEGASFYIFYADNEAIAFRGKLEEVGLKLSQCLIWVKNGFVLSRQDYHHRHEPCLYGWKPGAAHYFVEDRTQDTVMEEPMIFNKMKKQELIDYILKLEKELEEHSTIIRENKPLKNDIHPTMKPLKLLAKLIINSSRKDDIIMDLFGGSGSTLMAAEQINRTAYLMELDTKYADAIVRRYMSLNKDIKLIRDGEVLDVKELFIQDKEV